VRCVVVGVIIIIITIIIISIIIIIIIIITIIIIIITRFRGEVRRCVLQLQRRLETAVEKESVKEHGRTRGDKCTRASTPTREYAQVSVRDRLSRSPGGTHVFKNEILEARTDG